MREEDLIKEIQQINNVDMLKRIVKIAADRFRTVEDAQANIIAWSVKMFN
jgi:hypothetical protein